MATNTTGLISNSRVLYQNYGGMSALLKSSYFWISVVISCLCWRGATGEQWIELTKVILPPLAGFSVAAYALLFAVLDEKSRAILREPSENLGGRSPLLMLASSISHAVIVQILGIVAGFIFQFKPFPYFVSTAEAGEVCNIAFSSFGIFLTVYGTLLTVGSVLSVFRLLEIQSRI